MTLYKRSVLLPVLLLGFVFIYGCETIKGMGSGAGEGAKKDWQVLIKADDWVRKNLW